MHGAGSFSVLCRHTAVAKDVLCWRHGGAVAPSPLCKPALQRHMGLMGNQSQPLAMSGKEEAGGLQKRWEARNCHIPACMQRQQLPVLSLYKTRARAMVQPIMGEYLPGGAARTLLSACQPAMGTK